MTGETVNDEEAGVVVIDGGDVVGTTTGEDRERYGGTMGASRGISVAASESESELELESESRSTRRRICLAECRANVTEDECHR